VTGGALKKGKVRIRERKRERERERERGMKDRRGGIRALPLDLGIRRPGNIHPSRKFPRKEVPPDDQPRKRTR